MPAAEMARRVSGVIMSSGVSPYRNNNPVERPQPRGRRTLLEVLRYADRVAQALAPTRLEDKIACKG